MRRRTGGGPAGDPVAGWEVIDADDVIGTASARLLSTCADRDERLAALSLLGLLLDHADEAGRVRLSLDALARELDTEADRTVRLLQHLVTVEAVHAEGGAVVVAGGQPSEHALMPSRFLANLMTVLEREPAGPAPGTGTPGRATRARSQPDLRPRRRRALVAVGVGLAAMTLATAPSGDPATSLRTVSPPEAPTGRAPWAGPAPTPTTFGTGDGPVSSENAAPVEDDRPVGPERPDDGGATEAAGPPEGAAEDQLGQRPGVRESDPSLPGPRGAPDPAPTRPARPQLPASGTADAPSTPPARDGACPLGAPEAVVSSVELLNGLGSVLDLAGERLLVNGTVDNAAQAAVTIVAVEVGTGQGTGRQVESVATVPVDIPPGGVADWEATLLAGLLSPAEAVIDARVTDWTWADPDLAARCPS